MNMVTIVSFLVGVIFGYTTIRICGEIVHYLTGDYVDRKIYVYDLVGINFWGWVVILLHIFLWFVTGYILFTKIWS